MIVTTWHGGAVTSVNNVCTRNVTWTTGGAMLGRRRRRRPNIAPPVVSVCRRGCVSDGMLGVTLSPGYLCTDTSICQTPDPAMYSLGKIRSQNRSFSPVIPILPRDSGPSFSATHKFVHGAPWSGTGHWSDASIRASLSKRGGRRGHAKPGLG